LYGSYAELQLCLLLCGCETRLSHIRGRTRTRIRCSERQWVLNLYDSYHLSPVTCRYYCAHYVGGQPSDIH
jgi:hypothetical protein